ncbi:MAG: FapA family protein, partial [Symbiobacteriaceae bacterium]|nr:FapA family protein [Symbiobacteriaceae bacterium]
VLGDLGVGAINLIESRTGSVFIKGGVSGNSKAQVRAAQDIFTKYVLDSTLECQGKINIGFFSRNAYLKADELVIESGRGRIQGGRADIGILVTANEIGSEMEARTELQIRGFSREKLSQELEDNLRESNQYREMIEKAQRDLAELASRKDFTPALRTRLNNTLRDTLSNTQITLKRLEKETKNLQRYLQLPHEGEIRIRRINRNVVFYYNHNIYEIYDRKFGIRFICEEGMLIEKQG